MKYIVTGSSSGLGFSLCKKLCNHGDVLGLSRSLGHASILQATSNFRHLICDFSNPSFLDSDSYVAQNIDSYINNDNVTLILNAAAFYIGERRLSGSELEFYFHVNIISPIKLVNFIQKYSLRRVLFINSVSGLIGQDSQHEYVSTKHSLMGFSKSLAKTAKNLPFDVMSINPGGMKTDLWIKHPEVDTSDFLEPSLVADICEKILLMPGRVFIENFTILPPSDV